MLLLFVCSALAQEKVATLDTEVNLFTSVDQFSSPYTEPSEGSVAGMIDSNPSTFWHSNWSDGNAANGVHYFQVEVPDLPAEFGFTFTRRAVDNDHITKWSVYGVPATNPEAAKGACTLLATVDTPFGNNSETLSSPVIASKGFTIIRFYEEATTNSRGYFHVAEFAINPVVQKDAAEMAMEEMFEIYKQYSPHMDDFTVGTVPGLYPESLVNEFKAALTAAYEAVEGSEKLTAEQWKAIGQRIEESYNALVKGKIAYAPADGYYRILTAMQYSTTITTDSIEDPDSGEIIPGETITKYFTKAMYSTLKGANGWKTLDESDPSFIFKLQRQADGSYLVQNAFSELFLNTKNSASAVTESTTDSVTFVFDPLYTVNDTTTFSMRASTAAASGYVYLHQGGHGGGKGEKGNVVMWSCDCAADGEAVCGSNWKFEAVDASIAEALVAANAWQKDATARNDEFATILADAKEKVVIAKDVLVNMDTQNPLVKDASQLHSPMTTADEQCEDIEEVYTYLLDGNTDTYWHSQWENGNQPNGTHYLQISDIDAESVAFTFTRRTDANNDHATAISVYGYDEADDETEKAAGELLANLKFPFKAKGESMTSDVFPTKGHKVIRLYAEETILNRGYWHMSEFQMYPATINESETTQAKMMGDIYTNMMAALDAADKVNANEVSVEELQALKSAYTPFIEKFVDPTQLRETETSVTAATKDFKLGKEPGYWSSEDAKKAIEASVAAADAYDKAGVYTAEKSQELIDAMNAAEKAYQEAANQVVPGKWYRISFDNEENYEQYKWNKNNATSTSLGNLFENVIVAATQTDIEGEPILEQLSEDEIVMGSELRFMHPDNIKGGDAFRFVAVGDTAMALQHESGLYVATNGNLSLLPALLDVKPAGLGKNLIHARTIKGEEMNAGGSPVYLHAQLAGHKLVTWASSEVGSNSALYISEIDKDIVPAEGINISMKENTTRFITLPVGVKSEVADFYEFAGKKINGDEVTLSFNKISETKPGKPALMVYGELSSIEDSLNIVNAEPVPMKLQIVANDFAPEAETVNGVHGTYQYQWVDKGIVTSFWGYVAPATGEDNTDCSRDVSAYHGYLVVNEAEEYEGNADLTITMNATVTAVKDVLDNISTTKGNVYNAAGQLVKKNATMGDVMNMGRGLYIINGMKVLVK